MRYKEIQRETERDIQRETEIERYKQRNRQTGTTFVPVNKLFEKRERQKKIERQREIERDIQTERQRDFLFL